MKSVENKPGAGATRTLSEYVSALRYEQLPSEVVAKAKECILDQLGVQVAASTLEWNRIAYSSIRSLGGAPESTIVNYGNKTSAPYAAFVNGTFGHGCEFDDLGPNFGHGHPGSVVIPAALAMCEKEHISGKELIAAVVAGYEVEGRISLSCGRSILKRGFHNAWFIFGPVAAAARILRMDASQLTQAFGIAGSFAGGLRQYTKSGGETKRLHAGAAGCNGILAVLLARGGFAAPPDILEGETGFIAAFADSYDFEPLTHALGEEFLTLETGFKLVPCCGGILASLDTVLRLVEQHHIQPRDLKQITARLGATRIDQVGKIYEPQNVLGAQFSLPFAIALGVVKRRLDLRAFLDESLWRDPEILSFVRKVVMEPDADADKPYLQHTKGVNHRVSGSIELTLTDGTKVGDVNRAVRGLPGGAPITWEELVKKFEDNTAPILQRRHAQRVVDLVGHLETLDDVAELLPSLCA